MRYIATIREINVLRIVEKKEAGCRKEARIYELWTVLLVFFSENIFTGPVQGTDCRIPPPTIPLGARFNFGFLVSLYCVRKFYIFFNFALA